MFAEELIKVENFRRVDVKPGDKYVLMYHGVITEQMAADIKRGWEKFMGGDVPILILQDGMEIGVMRPSEEQPSSSSR